MVAFIIRIYEWMGKHRTVCWLSFILLTVLLSVLLLKQTYQEESGTNRIFAIFQYADSTKSDPDSIIQAIDDYVELLKTKDTKKEVRNLVSQIDAEKMTEMLSFIYQHIPYFLTDEDYCRFDSLLEDPGFIPSQVSNDKQMLMFPATGLLSENFQRDPLNFFTPVAAKLQNGSSLNYENYEGYIFTPDMKKAIIMLDSPYGSSETDGNAQLYSLLSSCAHQTAEKYPFIDIHFTGGPIIAVGNAKQIKTDSLTALAIAIVIIVLLLFYAFRDIWNILLIVISVAWGWLFAMGALTLIHSSVSMIVIGISSVIVGIAVNYPLHLKCKNCVKGDCHAFGGGEYHDGWCLFGLSAFGVSGSERLGTFQFFVTDRYNLVCFVISSSCLKTGQTKRPYSSAEQDERVFFGKQSQHRMDCCHIDICLWVF